MKLLLNICIYFIILLILYNIFDYLFSNRVIESLYNFDLYKFDVFSLDELRKKCSTKIVKKYGKNERLNNPRGCGHISRFWRPKTRRQCDRKRNEESNAKNGKNNRNNNRNSKIKSCIDSYSYSGFQKGYTDKTVYSEINNSHIVTEPPHSGEDPFMLGEELVKSDVVNAVYGDDSMKTALTTMIDTEIDNGLNYENYKTKYKTKLTENLKEKYKQQESQRRKEFVDVNDDQIIGNGYDPEKGSLLINDGNEQYSEIYMGEDDGQMSSLNTIKEDVYGRSTANFKDKYQTQANSYLTDWAEKIGALLKEQQITNEDINAGVQT